MVCGGAYNKYSPPEQPVAQEALSPQVTLGSPYTP